MAMNNVQNGRSAEFIAFRCKVTLYQCIRVENFFGCAVGDVLEKHEVKAFFDAGVNIVVRSRGGGGMVMGAPC